MGIQPSPITNEYCEINPRNCFPTSATEGTDVELESDKTKILIE